MFLDIAGRNQMQRTFPSSYLMTPFLSRCSKEKKRSRSRLQPIKWAYQFQISLEWLIFLFEWQNCIKTVFKLILNKRIFTKNPHFPWIKIYKAQKRLFPLPANGITLQLLHLCSFRHHLTLYALLRLPTVDRKSIHHLVSKSEWPAWT